ncbi:MAG: rhodanese-like domain-containing protein [Alphaproteobacteria bacterium]|nr:rhodanese-like domain-containing protein [Alphaproteobacteria bacterium]
MALQAGVGGIHEIGAIQARDELAAGNAVLIDVREAGEYMAERIPGALLSPLSTFNPQSLAALRGKRIIMSCLAGGRSMRAAQALAPIVGAENIVNLAGGIGAWQAAGLPVDRG